MYIVRQRYTSTDVHCTTEVLKYRGADVHCTSLSTSTSAPLVHRKERDIQLESLTVPLEKGAQNVGMLMKLQVDTGTNCSLLHLPELK